MISKGFTEEFYHKICYGQLAPVLDTLLFLKLETRVWLEVTTLLIAGLNDSEAEIASLCEWFLANLGPETPLHFSAFHPDYKVQAVEPTPASTLIRARQQARKLGLKNVYTGNIQDSAGQSTFCSKCNRALITQTAYEIDAWSITGDGCCTHCGADLAGHFESKPGSWGGRRQVVHVDSQDRH